MNTNDQTPQREIEALLSRHIGLNIDSLGTATLAQSMSQAMAAMGCTDAATFLSYLNGSEDVLEALVEAVVVPETSFFRSPESFAYLHNYLISATRTQTHPRSWKVLSLPCSTGEEPYSIAMTFLEAGVPSDKFQVDGVDISPTALTKAQQGIYQSYSFRRSATHNPERYTQQYFQLVQDRYHLDPVVKSQVRFYQGNLASVDCLQGHGPYDIVFCRNLLIYLHQAARDRALQNLYRLLVPNGLLFVGYAETYQIDRQRFALIRAPKAFVYRKLSPEEQTERVTSCTTVDTDTGVQVAKSRNRLPDKQKPSSSLSVKARSLSQLPVTSPKKMKADVIARSTDISNATTSSPKILDSNQQSFPKSFPTPVTTTQAVTENIESTTTSASQNSKLHNSSEVADQFTQEHDLISIRALADRDQLQTAMEQCHCYIKTHPASAEAYLLLGELYQAQGDDNQAEIAFQKTLYLNPNCVEAVIHWALLCEQRGDQATVQRLRRRLERLVSETFL